MFSALKGRTSGTYINATQVETLGCDGCRHGRMLDFDFTMAFQPLVDLSSQAVYGYEALVRGLDNASAYSIISQVNQKNIYRFDQTCRVKAIALAAQASLTKRLSINFMPGAVHRPDICIKTTLEAARQYQFPIELITFEVVETDNIEDTSHLKGIIDHYKQIGFSTALDDFGSGFANLNWLADLTPDCIKLDMNLIRGIHLTKRKQVIVSALAKLAAELEIMVVAEGIETREERDCMAELGIMRQQGFYFGRPALERFESVDIALLK